MDKDNAATGSTERELEDTSEENAGTAEPTQEESTAIRHQKRKRDAFTELMSRSSLPPTPPPPRASRPLLAGRDGLSVYIDSPSSFPPTRVISHDAHFVTIHDLYPKSSVHLLLLPRSQKHTHVHPMKALQLDTEFREAVQAEVVKLRHMVAGELRRLYGHLSKSDRVREEALNADIPADVLPLGRDWSKGILSGVHAHPSMNNLHIHVLSPDRVSVCMRHRKHYNSFATPFLVPVEVFPLVDGDERWHPGRAGYLGMELKCWRCGKGFGNKFVRLKEHLAEEFEEWKRE